MVIDTADAVSVLPHRSKSLVAKLPARDSRVAAHPDPDPARPLLSGALLQDFGEGVGYVTHPVRRQRDRLRLA